ncbi:MAG TPA: DEAD/DEAH box helicase family protein [Planctomycetota bacterium]|nr:DEAD/DEAH box helicase family protein [Planctomycetota bacterium]
MLTLRPYQVEAVEAVYRHLRERDDNPCVVLPTASGKTPVMATICKDAVGRWGGRVLILAHVKELLEQAVDKLRLMAPELMLQVGVYSAGLKKRDTDHPIIVAGIQSVYKRACDLGSFQVVLVDEAHSIAPEGDGMYRQFLADAKVVNPNVRVIGLTATPFRMKSGLICGPAEEGYYLHHICYEAGVRELIVQGYLCPLVTKASRVKADTSGLHVRAGEFVAGETEALMDTAELVESACKEIVNYTQNRRSVLIFAAGVKHAEHLASVLRGEYQAQVETVFGETLPGMRDQVLADFKAGRLKYLVNVNVLTTGFDAPNIDCVALVRPTMSPGLFYQMVGRGFRLHLGKADCLVLDFGGNALRHGPVDAIQVKATGQGGGEAPSKECPSCQAVIAAGYARCPQCGFEFPERERAKHEAQASTASVLSGEVSIADFPVEMVYYSVHTKRNAGPDTPPTMRVDYQLSLDKYVSEWVCLEHTGFARYRAEKWWKRRSKVPVPDSVSEAVDLAERGALASTKAIQVRSVSGERYDRVVAYELGEVPDYREPGWDADETAGVPTAADPDEIPF